MPNLISHLQDKSEQTRRYVALIVTFLLTGLIVIVWLSILYGQSLEKEDVRERSSEPLDALSRQLQEGWGAIQKEYGTVKEAISNLENGGSSTEESATSFSSLTATSSEPEPFSTTSQSQL